MAMENARRAANWGLTMLTVVVACAIYTLVLALGLPEARGGFLPIGLGVVVFYALAVVHTVLTIAGTVISAKRVFKNPLAIPYLRPPPPSSDPANHEDRLRIYGTVAALDSDPSPHRRPRSAPARPSRPSRCRAVF